MSWSKVLKATPSDVQELRTIWMRSSTNPVFDTEALRDIADSQKKQGTSKIEAVRLGQAEFRISNAPRSYQWMTSRVAEKENL